MTRGDDRTGGMGRRAHGSARKTDEKLEDQEARLLLETTVDLASLRPQVADQEAFSQLLGAVQEATEANNDVALLQQRVAELGNAVTSTARKVVGFLG